MTITRHRYGALITYGLQDRKFINITWMKPLFCERNGLTSPWLRILGRLRVFKGEYK